MFGATVPANAATEVVDGWSAEQRIGGSTRYETASLVSQASFPKAGVDTVVLASGQSFADATTAAPLAVKLDASLLFTAPNALSKATADELQRLKPSGIVVIGGDGAVSQKVAEEAAAAANASKVVRLGGANRYETSLRTVEYGWGADGADTLYIATGNNYPDALALGAAAGQHQAPLLLIGDGKQHADSASKVAKKLGASSSFIAGGPAIVSNQISSALAASTHVVRYAGSNRYETSADIASGQFLPTRGAFMATGENYPDALAAAAAAGREGQPLLLSRKTCLPSSGHTALKDLLVEDVTLVGGKSVLSPSTTPCDLNALPPRVQAESCSGGNLQPSSGTVHIQDASSMINIGVETLGQALPTAKSQGPLPVCLSIGTGDATFKSFGTIQVQGTSTARWPKKNWTLKWYSDKQRTRPILVQVGSSVPTDSWIAKAEWIDPTQSRNPLAFGLWEEMIASRNSGSEVSHSTTANNPGALGFPQTNISRVTMDGKHYGISTLTLGHDPDNFNIDPYNTSNIYMEFDARGGYTLEKTWTKLGSDGIGTWIDNYLSSTDLFTDDQKSAIDELSSVINGSQENFEAQFDKHFDKGNMIDMLLMIELLYDWDGRAQDLQVVSYDLDKWFFLPWDKDTTFGMNSTGRLLDPAVETKLLMDYENEDTEEKPWFKTYQAFRPEVEARYAQLRDSGIFSVENLQQKSANLHATVPSDVWTAEANRWNSLGRPSSDVVSTEQILTWFEARLGMLDLHFGYADAPVEEQSTDEPQPDQPQSGEQPQSADNHDAQSRAEGAQSR
ncbi:cell wall-binding repeat-containing protein [Schaalia sp. JY-X159]|uniref:cell wall-binding repeat-containing protein n=1 Tax=Schaalia sp. JY-X159 TaxID=2758575 RepID=UPI00165E634F|nr:cell wall-binding repeat-containing protein [Schaalia sp. JY-X159]